MSHSRRLLAALRLLALFLRAVLLSGLQTLVVILRSRPGQPPPVALLRVRHAPMSETGAVLLGCMVSLTPGTTTLDIDVDGHELLLHVLDATDTEALLRVIREDFEPGLLALFGRSAPR